MNWNNVLIALNKEFPYIYNNLEILCFLNNNVNINLNKEEIKQSTLNEKKLSIDEIFSLTEDIILSLNKKYYEIFMNLKNSGFIKIDMNGRTNGSYLSADGKQINFKYTGNYFDVCTLVHEFIHCCNRLTCVGKSPFNRQFFGETLAITFEMLTQNKLIEKSVDIGSVGLEIRANFEKQMTDYYAKMNFDKKGFKIKHEHSNVEITVDEEKMARKIGSHFQHLVGFIISKYILKKFTIDKIIELNDAINDFNSIDSVFEYLKINLKELSSLEFINENRNKAL